MAIRSANAVWQGTLREGSGSMSLGSGAFTGAYSFISRFEEGEGTNPEELIAAAHAGCFSMALAAELTRAGYTPTRVETMAKVHLDTVDGAPTVHLIELTTEAEVPGLSEAEFMEQANGAKANCPISRLLAAAEITLAATLVS